MPKKYTPAIFQPTVRPSWAGILKYVPEKERSDILEAIIKYPEPTNIQSVFWEETAKPDLETQFQNFVKTCEARGRGAVTYWGKQRENLSYTQVEHKDNLSYTQDKLKDNSLKDKNKDKDKDKDKNKDKVFIDELFNFGDYKEVRDIANTYELPILDNLQQFLIRNFLGRSVDVEFIDKMAKKFKEENNGN